MINCFCFPYAGGSARVYNGWQALLSEQIRLIPVELPGRGQRFREPLAQSLPDLIEGLGKELIPKLHHQPYALFGHSMGSLVAFELARWLRLRRINGPKYLFASGRRAPQLRRAADLRRRQPVSELSDEQLISELRALNGTPAEVLANKELLDLFLPIIRADFSLDDLYAYQTDEPLDCPIKVFGGKQDLSEVSQEALSAWRQQTSEPFSLDLFQGDHFFLFGNAQSEVLALLQSALLSLE